MMDTKGDTGHKEDHGMGFSKAALGGVEMAVLLIAGCSGSGGGSSSVTSSTLATSRGLQSTTTASTTAATSAEAVQTTTEAFSISPSQTDAADEKWAALYQVSYDPAFLKEGWTVVGDASSILTLQYGDQATASVSMFDSQQEQTPAQYLDGLLDSLGELGMVYGPYAWPDPWSSGGNLIRMQTEDDNWTQIYVAKLDGHFVQITLQTFDNKTADGIVQQFEKDFLMGGFTIKAQ
jgi:hypothetical protein